MPSDILTVVVHLTPDRQVKCKVCNTSIGRARDFLKHLREKHNCTSNLHVHTVFTRHANEEKSGRAFVVMQS